MALDGITGTIDAAAQQAALTANAPAKSQTMDSQVFMKLLVTQLENQDPSSPMDTNQMISQQTQLAMMEQLTSQTTTANEGFSLQMRIAAANLVGRSVTYTGSDGVAATGIASSVSFSGAVPTVSVDGHDIPLDSVGGVSVAGSATAVTKP